MCVLSGFHLLNIDIRRLGSRDRISEQFNVEIALLGEAHAGKSRFKVLVL